MMIYVIFFINNTCKL